MTWTTEPTPLCTGHPSIRHECDSPSFTDRLDSFLEKVAVECSIPVHMLKGESPGGMK